MKRLTSLVIMVAICLGMLPAVHAAEPLERWMTVKKQCEELGLQVTWYPEYEGLMRRYGTDRMLLVKGGQSYLCKLNSAYDLVGPFDAFGEFNRDGLAPACQNGKWGMVDMDGNTAVDFLYDGQYEAELAGDTSPVFRGEDGKDTPPYAVFTKDGVQLTEYKYQNYDRFVNRFAMVTVDGEGWGYVNTQGSETPKMKYRHDPLNVGKYAGSELTDYGTFDKEGYAMVCDDSGFNIINSQGRELLQAPTPKRPWRMWNGIWGYVDAESGKVGFINGAGKIIVPPQYDAPHPDPKGFEQLVYYGEAGVEEEWKYHEGLLRFRAEEESPWGFVNEAQEPVVPCFFDAAGYFDYGYASVMVDGVFGLLRNPLLTLATPEEPATEITFTDVPAGSWFEQGVKTCASAGIMVGVGEGTFLPNATLTDAECAMLAYRIYDQSLGGDGSLMKMPEDYGYIKIVSDDGSLIREGYAGDHRKWAVENFHYSADGYRLCLRGYPSVGVGGATLTFGGKEYHGELRAMSRGSGRYEQDRFLGFEPEDSTLNDLVQDAYYNSAPPSCWWADLLYTIQQRGWGGWNGVFASLLIFGSEESRGGFADLLGAVTDLPKEFDIPLIPDMRERENNSYIDHIYELYEAGIIGGTDAYGTFDSEKTLTRAEAAVMVARIIDPAQRLTTPPKPMPKEGEGYTLTYLRDGCFASNYRQDTYPYCVVGDFEESWLYVTPTGLLTLDGECTPWTEELEREKGEEIWVPDGWRNWGGVWVDGTEPIYYRWPDGSPATEHFDWYGKIGPDGRGFVQKDGKIYRIEFAQL